MLNFGIRRILRNYKYVPFMHTSYLHTHRRTTTILEKGTIVIYSDLGDLWR